MADQASVIIEADTIQQSTLNKSTRGKQYTRFFMVYNLPETTTAPGIANVPNRLLQIRSLTAPTGDHIPYMFDQHPSTFGQNLYVTNISVKPFPENSQTSAMVTVTYQDRYSSNFGLPTNINQAGQGQQVNYNGKLTITSTSNQKEIFRDPVSGNPLWILYKPADGSESRPDLATFNQLIPGLILEYDLIRQGSLVNSDFIGPIGNHLNDNLLNNDELWNIFGKYELMLRSVTGEQMDVKRDGTGFWWHEKVVLEYRPYPGWLEFTYWQFPDTNLPAANIDTTTQTSSVADTYFAGNGWVSYIPYQCYPFNLLLPSIGVFNPYNVEIGP